MNRHPDGWGQKTVDALNANRDAINGQLRDADDTAKASAACLVLADTVAHMHGNARFQAAREAIGRGLVELMLATVQRGELHE